MVKRLAAIVFIYVCVSGAWFFLDDTMRIRTYSQDSALRGEVGELWGTPQTQRAPLVYLSAHPPAPNDQAADEKGLPVQQVLDASDIAVGLDLEHRQKGLLWYSTYTVRFTGKYRLVNPSSEAKEYLFAFALPAQDTVYDDFHLLVGGKDLENVQLDPGGLTRRITMGPGEKVEVEVSYRSQGLSDWHYYFGKDVSQIKNFSLAMTTNFDRIDFPERSMSPTEKQRLSSGWKLTWRYTNLLSGVQIGMVLPAKLNPGPWVSEVTLFAPVSLFFFFFLLFIFTVVRKVSIHPMNYFFLGTAFFSFHLLLAYLVDHLSIHLSFGIASLVSIFLVVSYMRLVVGRKFAFLEVGISQFIYLVLFSYTFFFEGYTGLAVTVLSILTLFVVMQYTGRVDWGRVFEKSPATGEVAPARPPEYDAGQP